MNNIKKTALALITMAAISANISRADDGAVAVPPPRPFANLVTDDEALEAWVHGNGPNALYKPQLDFTFELPLNEIAKKIVLQFKNQFDLILPSDFDPATIMVKLELKNVNAIEIFNAMNMYFDTGNIPAHWKLTLNGSRPTAILEIKKLPVTPAPPSVEPARKHTVFSIAELLYMDNQPDKRAAWITAQVSGVLYDIQKPGHPPANESMPGGLLTQGTAIQIHKEAGLLVFTGTAEESELVHSTLEALKQTETQQILKGGDPQPTENLKK